MSADRIPECISPRGEHWPERYPGEFVAGVRLLALRQELRKAQSIVEMLDEQLRSAQAKLAKLRASSDTHEDPDALAYYDDALLELKEQREHADARMQRLRALIEDAESRDLLGKAPLTDGEPVVWELDD